MASWNDVVIKETTYIVVNVKDYNDESGLDVDVDSYTYQYSLHHINLVVVAIMHFLKYADVDVESDEETGKVEDEEVGSGDEILV